MRLSPWTLVCLVGFPLYGLVGWLHGGGGARAVVYYAVSGVLFASAVVGIVRGRAAKPPQV